MNVDNGLEQIKRIDNIKFYIRLLKNDSDEIINPALLLRMEELADQAIIWVAQHLARNNGDIR